MIEIIKNMFRRKTRTLLTVFGITIGIFAFVVMGSMAEKINLLVNGGTDYYSDKVTISQGSGSSMASVPTAMSVAKRREIEKVGGVAAVTANVYASLDENGQSISLGPPPAIIGTDLKGDAYETFKIEYSAGRALRADDRGKVVIGADLVKKLGAEVGSNVRVRGKEYQVVGIMSKTLTAPDNEVWMSLADAQKIIYKDLPEIIKSQSNPDQIVNSFTVYPKPGVSPDTLATRIESQVSDISASGPKDFKDLTASASGILNAILFGVAIISLLVGGLSIINTMTMSIAERIREIGIKKAVGAKTRNIMAEYLTEAGLIGLFGGLIGWIAGALTILLANRAMEDSGNVIFLLTPRITVIAITFAIVLGIIAGIYPAYHAVRINIVKALREG